MYRWVSYDQRSDSTGPAWPYLPVAKRVLRQKELHMGEMVGHLLISMSHCGGQFKCEWYSIVFIQTFRVH